MCIYSLLKCVSCITDLSADTKFVAAEGGFYKTYILSLKFNTTSLISEKLSGQNLLAPNFNGQFARCKTSTLGYCHFFVNLVLICSRILQPYESVKKRIFRLSTGILTAKYLVNILFPSQYF